MRVMKILLVLMLIVTDNETRKLNFQSLKIGTAPKTEMAYKIK